MSIIEIIKEKAKALLVKAVEFAEKMLNRFIETKTGETIFNYIVTIDRKKLERRWDVVGQLCSKVAYFGGAAIGAGGETIFNRGLLYRGNVIVRLAMRISTGLAWIGLEHKLGVISRDLVQNWFDDVKSSLKEAMVA